MNKFKIGDKIQCVSKGSSQVLQEGKIYKVEEVHFDSYGTSKDNPYYYFLEGTNKAGPYMESRFILVIEENSEEFKKAMKSNDRMLEI